MDGFAIHFQYLDILFLIIYSIYMKKNDRQKRYAGRQ
jgi:hypothetical protein